MKISEILEVYKPINPSDLIMVMNDEEILHLPVRVEDFDGNFPDMEVKRIYIDKSGFIGDLKPTLVLVVDGGKWGNS